jgi:hypothetical protein
MTDEISTEDLLNMRVVPEQRADLAAVQVALAVPTEDGARRLWADLAAHLTDDDATTAVELMRQHGYLTVPVLPAEPTDAMVEAAAKERQGQTLAAAHGAIWVSLSAREQDAYRADVRAILRAALAAGDPS